MKPRLPRVSGESGWLSVWLAVGVATAGVSAMAQQPAAPAPGTVLPVSAAPPGTIVVPASQVPSPAAGAGTTPSATSAAVPTPPNDLNNTLRRIEELERQIAIADLQKKLNEAQASARSAANRGVTPPSPGVVGATPGATPGGLPTMPGLPGSMVDGLPQLPRLGAQGPAASRPSTSDKPTYQVVSIVNFNGKGAAYVTNGSVTLLVREGDTFDGWKVAAIGHKDVAVSKVVTRTEQVPFTTQEMQDAMKPGAKPLSPKSRTVTKTVKAFLDPATFDPNRTVATGIGQAPQPQAQPGSQVVPTPPRSPVADSSMVQPR